MRQKTNPRYIDTENFVSSSQPFSQNLFASQQPPTQQLQYGDGQTNSQSTSTPVNHRQSQPLFGDKSALSPIPYDNDNSFGFDEHEQQPPYSFDNSVVSGYLSDEQNQIPDDNSIRSGYGQRYNEHEQQSQLYAQSVVSGYGQRYNEHEQQSQIYAQSVVSGYQSGGVDRFNSIHSTRNGRIKKRAPKRRAGKGNIEREIRALQGSTHNLLKLAPFARVVKEIINKMSGGKNFRVQSEAVQALMQACEAFLITLFEASYMCTNHAKRVTLKADDVQLVRRILSAFGTTMF